MSYNMLSSVSRYCARAVWLSLLFLTIFLWTFVHLNFSAAPLASHSGKSSQIAYSPPRSAYGDVHDLSPSNADSPAPSFNELAASPLKIYVPPKIPSADPLKDIWDTPKHTQGEGEGEEEGDDVEDEFSKDREAYYKALHCPVCVNEQQLFDVSQCPGADEMRQQILTDPTIRDCPIQPFDVRKCPNIAELNNRPQGGRPPPAAGGPEISQQQAPRNPRALISYVYTESPAAHRNLAFFVNHALHDSADFVFILNGPTSVDKDLLPQSRDNINIVLLPSLSPCATSPLGAHGEILGRELDGATALGDKYERFILVNGEVRGPFIPRWSKECWSEAILSELTDKVKMVGSELACKAESTPYLNTGLLALDKEGLSILLDREASQGINVCPDEDTVTNQATVKSSIKATRLIRQKGFEIGVLDGRWRQESEYRNIKCTEDAAWFRGIGLGIAGEREEMDPWEMLFVGTDMKAGMHDHGGGQLDLVSRRVGRTGYSSYEACKGV